jgi:ferritin
MKLLDFLIARHHPVHLGAIAEPRAEFASLLDVFESAQAQEKIVSQQIDALYEMAFTEKVFAAMAELQWFITEQVEEEKNVREIVAKLRMVKDDPSSILDLDRELGARAAEPAAGA